MADDQHPGDAAQAEPGTEEGTEPSASAEPDTADSAPAEPGTEDSAPAEPESAVSTADGPEPGAADSPGSGSPDLADPELDSPAEPGLPATDSADSPESETDRPTGTTPAWWSWVARHRKAVALVAGLVVVAVVATVVTVSVAADGPRDVVQSYMDAIHSGDVDAALAIAGKPEDDGRLAFLSADALADDWSVGAVVERHRRDDEADVDVTIVAGENTQQGRFHVVKGDDGWTIEAPFVDVELQVSGVSTVELGDVVRAADAAEPGTTIPLRVFPGVYDLYPSLAEQVTFEPGVLVAAPVPSPDRKLRFAAEYTFTSEGAAFANGAIARRVTECESATTIDPDGCPFSGEDERALFSYRDVTDVSWAVTRMPDARFVPGIGGPRMVLREPGVVTLSGSGFPYEPDGAEAEPFSVTCEFGVDNLAVAVTRSGLAVNGAVGRPYAAAEATHCF